MSPDTTAQTVAEPVAAPAEPSRDSAPSAPTERPQLASFADALNKAESARTRASKGTEKPGASADSDATGDSARPASKPAASTPSSDPDPASTDEPTEGEPASPDAPEPPADEADKDGKGTGKPSRRERADIARLTKERDDALAQLQAYAVPETVLAEVQATRLTDEEFNALASKKQREDVTGEYLTADEVEKLGKAIQARDLSQPYYVAAMRDAAAFAQAQRADLFNAQAEGLAPVLKDRSYLKADVIQRAASWTDIYNHFCDASEAHGRSLERAELQPKLDAAEATIAELETELKPLRSRTRSGPVLERGGVSGGAYSARPDFRTSSSSDLFAAAEAQAQQRRSRQAARRSA